MENKKYDSETIQKAMLGDKKAADILNQANHALPCPLCGCELQGENLMVGGDSLETSPRGITFISVRRHPNTGCLLDGNILYRNQLPFWNKRVALVYDTVVHTGLDFRSNPVSEIPNVCKHELEEIRYCKDDDYLYYGSDLLVKSNGKFKEKKKLMYCRKCGALFAKEWE